MLRTLREESDFTLLIGHRTETIEELRFSQYSLFKICIKHWENTKARQAGRRKDILHGKIWYMIQIAFATNLKTYAAIKTGTILFISMFWTCHVNGILNSSSFI
uniref:toll-like receptor 10 isoform X2 n=1 Tax=Halichoerus grypus TaxID=9711 RepID=UPI001659EBA4|nr:toll-like receptor 10 isoform X2 [Halichoerus grypus]